MNEMKSMIHHPAFGSLGVSGRYESRNSIEVDLQASIRFELIQASTLIAASPYLICQCKDVLLQACFSSLVPLF
jgi:hypothetical protein